MGYAYRNDKLRSLKLLQQLSEIKFMKAHLE